MSFKKPFRATPVRLGPYALAQERQAKRAATRNAAVRVTIAALIAGLAFGAVWSAGANRGSTPVRGLAPLRASAPPAGAYYPGCNAARAAGVAPIYRGEPGYRPELDGDDDGVACEPHRL